MKYLAILLMSLSLNSCVKRAEASSEEEWRPFVSHTVKMDGSCFAVFTTGTGVGYGNNVAAVLYPCPKTPRK